MQHWMKCMLLLILELDTSLLLVWQQRRVHQQGQHHFTRSLPYGLYLFATTVVRTQLLLVALHMDVRHLSRMWKSTLVASPTFLSTSFKWKAHHSASSNRCVMSWPRPMPTVCCPLGRFQGEVWEINRDIQSSKRCLRGNPKVDGKDMGHLDLGR